MDPTGELKAPRTPSSARGWKGQSRWWREGEGGDETGKVYLLALRDHFFWCAHILYLILVFLTDTWCLKKHVATSLITVIFGTVITQTLCHQNESSLSHLAYLVQLSHLRKLSNTENCEFCFRLLIFPTLKLSVRMLDAKLYLYYFTYLLILLTYYSTSNIEKNNNKIFFSKLSTLPHFQPWTGNSFDSLRAPYPFTDRNFLSKLFLRDFHNFISYLVICKQLYRLQ